LCVFVCVCMYFFCFFEDLKRRALRVFFRQLGTKSMRMVILLILSQNVNSFVGLYSAG
jgi:hypothetical protein